MDNKYRKKPVVIEAIQWTGENLLEVIRFTDGPPDTRSNHAGMKWEEYADLVKREGLKIFTLEGAMMASPGDWIIRGVNGEHYPCKPDIFAKTYEAADALEAQLTPLEQSANDESRHAHREALAEQVAMVKPLEWVENPNREYWYTAFADVLCYEVKEKNLGEWHLYILGQEVGIYNYCHLAKAAAQADYERRILSALTIRSADEVRAEGYAAGIEAAKKRLLTSACFHSDVGDVAKSSGFVDARNDIASLHTADSLAALDRVRQEERERCAKVAATFVHSRLYEPNHPACSYHSKDIAAAILGGEDE